MTWSQLKTEGDASQFLPATVASLENPLTRDLKIEFPNTDWQSLQSVYGWAAFQWQGWARGCLKLNESKNRIVSFNVDNVLEFWVNDAHYFGGDYYAYQRQPVMLDLSPGKHRVDIRLIRDVRVMGGIGQPDLSIQLSIGFCPDTLIVDHDNSVFPEIVNGKLAGSYASIAVANLSCHVVNIYSVDIDNWETDSNPLSVNPQNVGVLKLAQEFHMLNDIKEPSHD